MPPVQSFPNLGNLRSLRSVPTNRSVARANTRINSGRAGTHSLRRFASSWTRQFVAITAVALILLTITAPAYASAVSVHPPLPTSGPASSASSGTRTPNLPNAHHLATTTMHLPPPAKLKPFTPARSLQPFERTNTAQQPSFTITLAINRAVTATMPDGRLTVSVPAGAITAADLAALSSDGDGTDSRKGTTAVAQIALRITQVAPASGSNTAGTVISFGTYTIAVVDGNGHLVAHGLRQPIMLTLHFRKQEAAFDLDHAFVVFNDGAITLPTDHDTAKQTLSVTLPADSSLQTPGTNAGHVGTNTEAGFSVLQSFSSLSSLQSSPNFTTLSWDTNPALAQYGAPDTASRGMNAGAFATTIPIEVPSGPGGLMPPLTLQYNSANVSDQHSPRAPASWVGEGWTLDLGKISWSEHSPATSQSGVGCCSFQDEWHWTDPYGVSTDLIPPTNATALFYDDSPNGITPSPIQWQAASENYAQIFSINGPNALPDDVQKPPCFQIFLANGLEEEYGCTADSLQWYKTSGTSCQQHCDGGDYVANWLLDKIVDPFGNTITVTYQRSSSGTDTELSTITWDAPSPGQQQLHRVVFNATTNPAHVTNTPSNCNPGTSFRCDDPVDLSGSGGLAAPKLMGSMALNSLQVQTLVGSSWSTIRSYQFSYEESGPQTITDSVTNKAMSVAGFFDLTKVQEVGTDGVTSYPPTTLGYATLTEYYEDSTYQPQSLANCGPSWNTGNGGACFLWSQSYAGNSRYLATIDNGQGLHQALTWQNARNNTHGTPAGGSPANPFYCNTNQAGYPCNAADDQAWSRIVLTELDKAVTVSYQYGQGGYVYSYPMTTSTVYSYLLTYPLAAEDCGDCVAGMYWGDQTDTDFLDYYNERFMGFAQVSTSQSDGSVQVHNFYATEGIGVYDAAKVTNCPSANGAPGCHAAPWWDTDNVAHGWQFDEKDYADDGTTLLTEESDVANPVCPPVGVSPTPQYYSFGPWDGNLVAELDHGNPVAVCDVQHGAMNSYDFEGSTSDVQENVSYLYDGLGRIVEETQQDFTSGATPKVIETKTTYVWESDLNISPSGWQEGAYKIDAPAQVAVEDGNGHRVSCERWEYDYDGYQTGQVPGHIQLGQNYVTDGTELVTADDRYTSCGSAPSYTPAGLLQTTYDYTGQTSGNGLGNGTLEGITTPNANAGAPGQTKCVTQDNNYAESYCINTDALTGYLVTGVTAWTGVTPGAPTILTNSTDFDSSAAYGYGLWPKYTTDANNQNTTTTYDALGRVTEIAQPGDTAAAPTTSYAYTTFCPATGAAAPCVEIDTTQRLNSTTKVTTRAFYDGAGRLVETRTPAANGQDSVQYTLYGTLGRLAYQSVPYFVPAYTGAPGATAYSVPDFNQPGSSLDYDGLGRITYAYNALGNYTSFSYVIVAGVGSDSAHYVQVLALDANNHETDTLTDALGRVTYARSYTGNSPSTWAIYATTAYTYDAAGRLLTTTDPLNRVATRTYDTAGRLTSLSDPDLGLTQYSYDANGNPTKITGPMATAYLFYDNLDRRTALGPNADGSNPIATWSYDSATNGKGRLATETFSNPGIVNGAVGEYDYAYDARGDVTNWTMMIGTSSANEVKYPFSFGYNDANQQTSVVYPDGDTVTKTLSPQDQLSSVTETLGSATTTLASAIGYSGFGGAAGLPTSAQVGNNSSTWTFSYNSVLQSIETQVQSAKSIWYDQKVTYDPVGNTQAVDTTLPTGTDNQQFCYDELDRLTSASTNTTTPCGTQSAGTLSAANYTESFTYDQNNRLTTGPLGSYTYGNVVPGDAVTAIGPSYTAAYNTAGDMTCRSLIVTLPCSASTSSTTMSYDILNRLQGWQDEPTKPTMTAQYSYDGEGNRVQQVRTNLATQTSTTTQYIGAYEQISTTGGTGGTKTTTKYYDAGVVTAVSVNGAISYLVQDALGSINEAISSSGNTALVTATQLFTPYGGTRYTTGSMPTVIGFTGQQGDPSGLVYMNARYYDPLAGQFTSADTVQGPNRFGYVAGNPTSFTDPTGHTGYRETGEAISALERALESAAKVAEAEATYNAAAEAAARALAEFEQVKGLGLEEAGAAWGNYQAARNAAAAARASLNSARAMAEADAALAKALSGRPQSSRFGGFVPMAILNISEFLFKDIAWGYLQGEGTVPGMEQYKDPDAVAGGAPLPGEAGYEEPYPAAYAYTTDQPPPDPGQNGIAIAPNVGSWTWTDPLELDDPYADILESVESTSTPAETPDVWGPLPVGPTAPAAPATPAPSTAPVAPPAPAAPSAPDAQPDPDFPCC